MQHIYQRKYPHGHYVYAYIRNKNSKIAQQGTPYYINKLTVVIGTTMFDFIRLLHLSGLLLESDQITPEQAIMIFKHYGATDDDLLPHNLKKTYVKLAKNHHPDLTGGDSTPMQYINRSYDLLKAAASTSTTPQTGVQPERRRINCPHCKKQIVNSFVKCPWCGTKLTPYS